MKRKSAIVVFLLLLSCSSSFAQRFIYASALSSEGVLMCRYEVKEYEGNAFSLNAIEDTISVSQAGNIFALQVIYILNNQLRTAPVAGFEMWIIQPQKDTLRLSSSGAKITGEMKKQLEEIKSNTRLVFVGIRAMPEEASSVLRGICALLYYVR